MARKQALAFYENYADVYQEGLELKKRQQLDNELLDGIEIAYEGVEVDLNDENSKSLTIESDAPKLSDELLQKLDAVVATLDSDLLLWNEKNAQLREKETEPAILLIKDQSLLEEEYDSKELIIQEYFFDIDSIDPYKICELMMHLDEESKLYSKYGYDTDEELVNTRFWDAEVYYEGSEGEMIMENHEILRTDFDWTRYSLPNWWNDPGYDDYIEETILATIVPKDHDKEIQSLIQPKDSQPSIPPTVKEKKTDFERICLGEGLKTEFKPDLFGHDRANDRSFKYEAAKTICAFLNSKGGYLYIGVKDDGSIAGIDMKELSKDEFIRKYKSEIVNYYLERGVVDANVHGKFINIEGKDIFRIKVNGSFKPMFLLNKDWKPLKQEFYIRSGASSYLLWDVRHLLDYVKSHWWTKNYKRS